VYYYHHDHLNSTIAVTDESANVVEQYRYDVYGQPYFYGPDGVPRSESALDIRFLFTGREWLASLSLYDYRHRAYSPSLGRFLQMDPLGFGAGDVNVYAYCADNPVHCTDPYGQVPWMFIGMAVGAGIDLGVQLVQGRSLREVNWVSVGASAASGALGAGLSAKVAKWTGSILGRAVMNAAGSAAIGGGVQAVRNVVEGRELSADVGKVALVSGSLGGVGSAAGDLLQRGIIAISQDTPLIQSLRRSGVLLKVSGPSSRYLLPGERLPPSTGSIIGTTGGVFVSNLGPVFFLDNDEPCE